jgi:hypothetical protein
VLVTGHEVVEAELELWEEGGGDRFSEVKLGLLVAAIDQAVDGKGGLLGAADETDAAEAAKICDPIFWNF